MDPTISVSKGVFVFKNGAVGSKSKEGRKCSEGDVSILKREIKEQPYYQTYQKIWKALKSAIDKVQTENYTKTMEDLVQFVQNSYGSTHNLGNMLPVAALLTGINQPDHYNQFQTLSLRIRQKCSGLTVILQARDCPNIKSTIESLVSGFIGSSRADSVEDHVMKSVRRAQCTMHVLESWYRDEYPNGKRILTVIMPGFECFNVQVMQDLILILKGYCDRLPIVLVVGVATAVSTLHGSLPYHVTSQMRLKIFQMQSAIVGLNEILHNAVLFSNYPIHLSGKVLKFLTDTFLFYDFSINGLVQGIKYCVMEHYYQGNAFSLCDSYLLSREKISNLTHDEIEAIRHLPSFRPYVERLKHHPKEVILLLTDDEYLKKRLPKFLRRCHIFLTLFRCFLEFFTTLVEDLPKTPLGRLPREIYSICASSKVTELPEFKECWQLISFHSKAEFVSKIRTSIKRTEEFMAGNLDNDPIGRKCRDIVFSKFKKIQKLLKKVLYAGVEVAAEPASEKTDLTNLNRHELKETLLKMSKSEKPKSEFVKSIEKIMDYIKYDIILKYLLPFNKEATPLLELFVFSDISKLRQHIVGAPRAALHTALNNPHHYLQCNCCELVHSESLMSTLPDISIAYKLHLESGRLINLYDWLQAFRYVIDSNVDDSEQINPQVQARFTRAVAELQFLGFIKSTKKKTDHVTRLTW